MDAWKKTTPRPTIADRGLALLDQLARAAGHELETLAAELAGLHRDEALWTERGQQLAQEVDAVLVALDGSRAADRGIDIDACFRQRAWLGRLRETQSGAEAQLARVREHVEAKLDLMRSAHERMQVLQRAHERRAERLALAAARREHSRADERQVLRALSGERT